MKKNSRFTGKRNRLAAIALTLAMTLTGCGGSTEGTGTSGTLTPDQPAPAAGSTNLTEGIEKVEIPDTPMSNAHGSALSKSGFLLLQKTTELSGDGKANVLISPISLQAALGMTAAGSEEGSETQKELMAVLMPGVNGMPAELNAEMAGFSGRMQNSQDVEWHMANSVWVNNNGEAKLRDTYLSTVKNYYHAELYSAPFNAETLKQINDWVSRNTKERIPEIINELSPEAVIALVNAICYDAEWSEPVEESQIREEQPFTNADGSESKVTMMSTTENRYLNLAGGVGFIRPYKGGQYSFVGLLPPEGMSTDEYLKKITESGEDFAEAYLKADQSKTVEVLFPEFKTEYGTNMNQILQGLGINRSFTDDAQFGGMVTEDSVPVKIGTVEHKAMIEVDRKGTRAAAATVVMMDKCTGIMIADDTVKVTLDRPFVYAIVDDTTGVPVFLGIQNTMAGE